MVQVIPNENANVLGKIGKGFAQSLGQGLSEQIPKEAERYRLSQGLQKLQKKGNSLSPLEFATELYQIPGVTPAMIQSLPDLYKQQYARTQRTEESQQPNAVANARNQEANDVNAKKSEAS